MQREATQQQTRQVNQVERSKDSGLWKPLVLGTFVFLTLGLSVANEILLRFGWADNYVSLFCLALVLAVLLLSQNLFMLGLVTMGVIALNTPEATLIAYHVDKDVLLASICAVVMAPIAYQAIFK